MRAAGGNSLVLGASSLSWGPPGLHLSVKKQHEREGNSLLVVLLGSVSAAVVFVSVSLPTGEPADARRRRGVCTLGIVWAMVCACAEGGGFVLDVGEGKGGGGEEGVGKGTEG